MANRETTIGQKTQSLKELCFCLSSSPDKQKTNSLRPLWFDLAHHPESIEGRLCGEYILIRANLRQSADNIPLSCCYRRSSILHPPSSVLFFTARCLLLPVFLFLMADSWLRFGPGQQRQGVKDVVAFYPGLRGEPMRLESP